MAQTSPAEQELERRKRQAELEQAIAEAEQKIAEAAKAKQVAAATAQQAVAEAQQKAAEAEQARLLAALPKSEMKGLEGTLTVDEKFGYVARIAGYRAAFEAVDALAAEIGKALNAASDDAARAAKADKKPNGADDGVTPPAGIDEKPKDASGSPAAPAEPPRPDLVIVDDFNLLVEEITCAQLRADLSSLTTLVSAQKTGNDTIRSRAREALEAGEGPAMAEMVVSPAALMMAPQAIQSLVSIAADIAGFFKSDVEVKGQEFELARQAIVNELAGKLKDQCTTHVPGLGLLKAPRSTPTLDAYAALLSARRELLECKEKLVVLAGQLKEQIAADEGRDDEKQAASGGGSTRFHRARREALHEVETGVATGAWLAGEVDALVKLITAPGEAGKPPLLVRAALLDRIRSLERPHFLWIQVVSTGGEARTERRRLSLNSQVSFLGGGVLSYVLADAEGRVELSGSKTFLGEIRHEMATEEPYSYRTVKESVKRKT